MDTTTDMDRRTTRKAVAGIVVCAILLAVTGAAIMIVRYYPVRHVGIIKKYSEQYGLEPAFVFAVINAESRFVDNAKSSMGASGLMQLMEDTANWIAPMAGIDDFDYAQVFDPDINIHLGCFYLNMHYKRFGSLENALCAYNAGGGSVESWLSDPQYSTDGMTLDVIPYAETRLYVERVYEYVEIYRFLLRFV